MKILASGEHPRVSLSVPYPEGAILQQSRYLSNRSLLDVVLTPSRGGNRIVAKATARIPGLRNLSGRLNRGLPELPQLEEVMPSLELRRLLYKFSRNGVKLGAFLNSWKAEFDHVVSRRIPTETSIVVGMPGASLETFTSNPHLVRVFHEVDSHPAVHNELLLQAYPKRLIEEYLHPMDHISRITAEIEAADYVLTPSAFVSSQMQTYGKSDRQIVQVPYGVDLTHFRPGNHPRESRKIELIYAGQIRYGKGLPFLFTAMRRLPDIRLSLVGPTVHPAVLEDLPDNCRYLGVMSTDRLVSYMNESDAFVYPSLEDNFVLAVPEALACGLPVIVTDHVGAAEFLSPEEGLIVPAADASSLVSAISSLSKLTVEGRRARAESFRDRATSARNRLGCSWEAYSAEVWSQLGALIVPAGR
ncbi:glycosyltransferase family 4 protein [Arthrobacter sp. ZGTC131]|uniref:glycosyltransferase family 4 protein n=1 Tax=Arthrobacter sp. ZGTC131 TaxID=2058898 RepID=UPI000CE579AA|nr:glycosyltransferase family 4 protein [Arthrobacter sp. ZGTC131]